MTRLERAYAVRRAEDCDPKTQPVFRKYSEQFPNGSVTILPLVQGYGNSIRWEVRAHIKNAAGPLRLTREEPRRRLERGRSSWRRPERPGELPGEVRVLPLQRPRGHGPHPQGDGTARARGGSPS